MHTQILQEYEKMGVSKKTLQLLNNKLKLPEERLTAFAKPRREEALKEALSWPKGTQKKRVFTELYSVYSYKIGVEKPGKEAARGYKLKHYKTGKQTNNKNDMLPLILKGNERADKDLSFEDMFSRIEKLMHSDLFGLELLGTLLFRAGFMLDHKKNKDGNWRYEPPVISILQKRIPKVSGIPIKVFLHYLEVLSINEDVKVYTLGHDDFKYDYGRINTLLTFSHLVAVLLNRRSLAKFAGQFARPPSGMAPIPKTERGGIFEAFPLLSNLF